jgi:hypothetical protein
MSQEFAKFTAPQMAAENVSKKDIASINERLDGKLYVYKTIADEVYAKALAVAESIDEREETLVPFRRNAVYLASLLTTACRRGAQIA